MPFPDWGNVPGWLGAGSLLLAFRIFFRDRANKEREQVDLVGVWCVPKYEWRPPGQARVEEAKLEWFVRNGSQLPVQVAHLAYDVHSCWMVRDLEQWRDDQPGVMGPWQPMAGTGVVRQYIEGIRVPPQETWSQETGANVAHLVPEHADQLELHGGIRPEIRWVLLVDNAGRRWVAQPSSGGPTRRVRWYSWRHRDYPLAWRRPPTLWLNRKRYQIAVLAWHAYRFVLRRSRDRTRV